MIKIVGEISWFHQYFDPKLIVTAWELPSYDKFGVEMLVEPRNFPHYLYNEIIVLVGRKDMKSHNYN